MEDNNRKESVNAPEKNAGAPQGEGHNRHRRGHRGGKKHGDRARREQNALREQTTPGGEAPAEKREKAPKQSPQNKHAANPAEGEKQKEKSENNRDRHGGRRNHGRRDKDFRRNPDNAPQKDDIYGDPNEERELAEWRAKIVLNAAETTVPAKEEKEETPLPVNTPVEQNITEEEELPPDETLTPLPTTEQEPEEKVEVIGIRFRSAAKMYYFDPKGNKVEKGAYAIVETARGPEFGDVCLGNTMVKVSETVSPLRPLIRVATPADVAHNEENRAKEKDALLICQKKIADHKLEMKLIEVQYAFDNSKLLFYFSAEGRVDFRELVKDLASVFRTRIELRQIGIRDEAKMLGGLGACGRILCCSTFLPDFAQVSIKMAKEQGLSLNSAKISGMCGRLMCCLRFESDVYTEEIKLTPPCDSLVKTEDGIGTVISTNPLAGTIRVILKDDPEAPPKQYHRDNVTVLGKNKPGIEQNSKENEN